MRSVPWTKTKVQNLRYITAQPPDVVDALYDSMPQQVREYGVFRTGLAGVGLGRDALDTHLAHHPLDAFPIHSRA